MKTGAVRDFPYRPFPWAGRQALSACRLIGP